MPNTDKPSKPETLDDKHQNRPDWLYRIPTIPTKKTMKRLQPQGAIKLTHWQHGWSPHTVVLLFYSLHSEKQNKKRR